MESPGARRRLDAIAGCSGASDNKIDRHDRVQSDARCSSHPKTATNPFARHRIGADVRLRFTSRPPSSLPTKTGRWLQPPDHRKIGLSAALVRSLANVIHSQQITCSSGLPTPIRPATSTPVDAARPSRPDRHAPVAQLDRASDYESEGQRFESFRARHLLPSNSLAINRFRTVRMPRVDRVVDQNRTYTFIKGGVFYFSRRVPRRLQSQFDRTRVVACLHTRSAAQARKSANTLSAQLETVWAQMRLESVLRRVQTLSPTLPQTASTGPSTTLSEAGDLYRRLKGGGKGKGFKAYTDRHLGYVVECLGDAAISDLKRTDAWPVHRRTQCSQQLFPASSRAMYWPKA